MILRFETILTNFISTELLSVIILRMEPAIICLSSQKRSINQIGSGISSDKDQAIVHAMLGKDLEQIINNILPASYV